MPPRGGASIGLSSPRAQLAHAAAELAPQQCPQRDAVGIADLRGDAVGLLSEPPKIERVELPAAKLPG